jgi:hypothetical protein
VPLVIASTIEEGRLSLFSPAPLLALLLLVLLLVPAGNRMVTRWLDSRSTAEAASA